MFTNYSRKILQFTAINTCEQLRH